MQREKLEKIPKFTFKNTVKIILKILRLVENKQLLVIKITLKNKDENSMLVMPQF